MDGPFELPAGIPDDLRAAARAFRLLAYQHDAVRLSVTRIADETREGWTGPFADRFGESAAEITGRFKPVCEAAMDIFLALTGYASALEDAQQAVADLNYQASQPAYTGGDPVIRAQAVGQLRRQATAAADELDAAAATFTRRIGMSMEALKASLPDPSSSAELLADIQRADLASH